MRMDIRKSLLNKTLKNVNGLESNKIINAPIFKIDDRIIIKIIDEFVKKYDYSETSNLAPLFIFINSISTVVNFFNFCRKLILFFG